MTLAQKWWHSSYVQSIFHDWQRLLSHLLWTIILLQFVSWLSEFWLPETRLIVIVTLSTILAFEVVIPTKWLLRRVLQCLALIVVHVVVLDMPFTTFIIPATGGIRDVISSFSIFVYENTIAFFPYIWFSLVTCVVYLAVVTLTRKKGVLYFTLISCIIFFALLDSFSFHILWRHIAIIILCGLLLAINQHFSEFAQKHPTSWNYVKEYPGMMISFVVVIVSFTMIVGVLAPNVRPLIVDPYTAWKHMRGEKVQSIGKGHSNFALSFQGESSSGYRRDDTALGEGFQFDYSEIMKLRTTHRSYLRGETRSHYTGSGWEKSVSESSPTPYLVNKNQILELDSNIDNSKLKTHEVQQHITIKGEVDFPVLFGGYAIEKIVSIEEEKDVLFSFAFWSPRNAIVLWHGWDDYYPETYQLISQMPIIDFDGLRTTSADAVDTLVMAEYLNLPGGLPERVTALAREIAQFETNQYDQVKAIESYLKQSFPYTNEPDLSKGESDDFVDRFLFEIQEGYCDYYSTAMVVLARSLGIPARWVKGFSSGVLPTYDHYGFLPEELYTDPDAGGDYTIRNADAHSWVEVYFEQWGWIPFEPTAGFSLPMFLHEEEGSANVPDRLEPNGDNEAENPEILESLIHYISIPIVILLLAVAIIVVSRKRLFAFLAMMRERRDNLPQNLKVIREFNRLIHYARKRGYVYEEHETAREIAQSWIESNMWLKDDLKSFLNLFERAKYSEFTITLQEYNEAMQLYKKLRAELK